VKPRKTARKGPLRQRQRLIDACISALHIYGPSRTTVEKVVAIAKMSPGIVRFYFDSKAAMLVASLQFLAAEFEEQVLVPVARLRAKPVAALQLLVDLYLDPDIASPRKVSVWYAFWGEASSRQEYYDICGQKDESFATLVRELIENLINQTSQTHLEPDGVALGLIGALEMLWQDFAFQTEESIDRGAAKERCMAYLRSVFPGQFAADGATPKARFARWAYADSRIMTAERDLLFHGAWTFAGHESQLPRAGDFFALDVGTERAVVVRDAFGRVHALRNACPESLHAIVVNRGGRMDAIECKSHGLKFALNGRRIDAPCPPDLTALDMQEVGGLIFLRSPQPKAGAHETARVLLAGAPDAGLMLLHAPSEIPVAADWKVVVEQWLEWWSTQLADDGALGLSDTVAPLTEPGWSAARYRHLLACAQDSVWRRQFLAPNQLFESRPDGLSVIQALPIAAGRCVLRRFDFTVMAPDDGARAAGYLAGRLGAYARRGTLAMAESTPVTNPVAAVR
jgi:TetR/AcrR family transcriptional repressor of bet genes